MPDDNPSNQNLSNHNLSNGDAPNEDRCESPASGDTSRKRLRFRGDHGEGVISAAIAVLIMAFLGAAMWVGFQQMWKATEATTNDKITQIGSE